MRPLILTITISASLSSAFVIPNSHIKQQYHIDHEDTKHIQLGDTHNQQHTHINLFGNLFGSETKEDEQLQEGELARISYQLSSNDNPTTKFDSLSRMILSWSKIFFSDDKKAGLTTPVTLVELPQQQGSGDITNYSGVQLLFKTGTTGGKSAYQDKDDEKNEKSKQKEEVKEGGVDIRVEQLQNGDLQVTAKRCNVDEDTMIKEMSEQTIIESLRKAVAAWKNEQSFQ